MEQSDRWLLFLQVVASGSFSGAARQRRQTRSMVSKQFARLEAELGIRLINRTTRSLSLTEAGRALYQQALNVRENLRQMEELVASLKADPSGLLRVTCNRHFGLMVIQPMIACFLKRYPSISLELVLDDDIVDLVGGGFDVAIRIGAMEDSNLVARKLVDHPLVLVTSPAFLSRCGQLESLKDVSRLDAVVYAWRNVVCNHFPCREDGRPAELTLHPRLWVNDGYSMLCAARAGVGLAVLSRFLAEDDLKAGTLV